ncbi:hypothetical protein ACFPC0_20935 [Streptomyces andamanensis]|uniref:Uncharacterized protein n=1 Tax=Streptomyces andamanensis TaxID=1565035 RepID=A0ABV8THT5_9ACTN
MAGLFSALIGTRRSGRVRLPTGAPQQGGRPGATGPGSVPLAGASGTETGAFTAATQRVRLILEGADDPDEEERAIEALTSQRGWKVRAVRPRDGLTVPDGHAALIVDALAHGQRRTAVGAVREQAARLLRQPPVGFRIREAELVRHQDEPNTTLVRVMRRRPPDLGGFRRWLWRYREAMGGADTGRVLTVALLPEEDGEQLKVRVKEQWAALTRNGAEFDDDLYDLRLSIGPRPRADTDGPLPRPGVVRRFGTLWWLLFAVLIPLASGWTLASLSSPWRYLALFPPLATFGPVGYWVTSNEPRPRLLRLAWGVFVVGCVTWVSYQWSVNSPGGLGAQIRGMLPVLLTLEIAVGCWHAFSRSWLSRNLLAILPVFLAPLPFVLPWAGSFLHTAYLEEVLGIPESAVHIAFYWQYFVALKPAALTLAIMLFYVSLYGWAKYFNLHVSQGIFLNTVFPFLILLAILGIADRTLNEVQTAAERAYLAATRGEQPPAYYGLKARLMCVRPVEPGKTVSVQPGPLPTRRPVLVFPREGDTLWVWDPSPERGRVSDEHAVRMRAEDVSLYPATGTSCP